MAKEMSLAVMESMLIFFGQNWRMSPFVLSR